MNNAIKQFEEMCSGWSLLDKGGEGDATEGLWQRAQTLYQAFQWSYNSMDCLTTEEWNYVGQLQQWFQVLQAQKMKVDHGFVNEMLMHLAKMAMKR